MEISITELIFLMIIIPLSFMGVWALFTIFQLKHYSLKKNEQIYFCTSCGNVYAVMKAKPNKYCPRCKSPNQSIDVDI